MKGFLAFETRFHLDVENAERAFRGQQSDLRVQNCILWEHKHDFTAQKPNLREQTHIMENTPSHFPRNSPTLTDNPKFQSSS